MAALSARMPPPGDEPMAIKFLGILYAEEFDDEPAAPAPAPDVPDLAAAEPGPAEPSFTAQELASACARAVDSARAQWQREAAQEQADALAAIAAALASGHAGAEQVANAAAEACATGVLSILMGLLPKLCAEHGPGEVRATLDRLLPLFRSQPKVTVRVHPDQVAGLRRELGALDAEHADRITVAPAALEPGDLKVSWDGGQLVRDTRGMIQAVHDVLHDLRLSPPLTPAPKGTLTYAE